MLSAGHFYRVRWVRSLDDLPPVDHEMIGKGTGVVFECIYIVGIYIYAYIDSCITASEEQCRIYKEK